MAENNGRIQEYDGLKGVAILGIMFVHLTSWSGVADINNITKRLSDFGAYGVEITFVLNAVLLSKAFANWKKFHGGVQVFL